jgi:uncharacterized repeat protein (TIGR03833 family)
MPSMNLQVDKKPNMFRSNIKIGQEVKVVLKKDQRTGKLTPGKVHVILTSSAFHSRGIKVQLDNYQIGRVQEIVSDTI